jgi:hypothetical protein
VASSTSITGGRHSVFESFRPLQGTWYKHFRIKAQQKFGQAWTPGSTVFQYPNDHRASTLWYHDHTLGMTRAKVLEVVAEREIESLPTTRRAIRHTGSLWSTSTMRTTPSRESGRPRL